MCGGIMVSKTKATGWKEDDGRYDLLGLGEGAANDSAAAESTTHFNWRDYKSQLILWRG